MMCGIQWVRLHLSPYRLQLRGHGGASSPAAVSRSNQAMAPYGAAEASGSADSENALRSSFAFMSACFAVNHGLATVPLVLASSLLEPRMSFIGMAVFYATATVSSLCVAVPLGAYLGPHLCMVAGMALFGAYVGGFALAICISASWLQWPLWLVASSAGGLAGGLVWTAQGTYYSAVAAALASATGKPAEVITGTLAGSFSFVFLSLEVSGGSVLCTPGIRPSVLFPRVVLSGNRGQTRWNSTGQREEG